MCSLWVYMSRLFVNTWKAYTQSKFRINFFWLKTFSSFASALTYQISARKIWTTQKYWNNYIPKMSILHSKCWYSSWKCFVRTKKFHKYSDRLVAVFVTIFQILPAEPLNWISKTFCFIWIGLVRSRHYHFLVRQPILFQLSLKMTFVRPQQFRLCFREKHFF